MVDKTEVNIEKLVNHVLDGWDMDALHDFAKIKLWEQYDADNEAFLADWKEEMSDQEDLMEEALFNNQLDEVNQAFSDLEGLLPPVGMKHRALFRIMCLALSEFFVAHYQKEEI